MCIARKSAAKKHSLPNSTKKKKEKKEKNAKTKKSVEKSTTPTPTSTPPATTSPPPAKKSETIGGGGGGGGKKPSQIKIVEIESKKSLTTALPANTPPVKKVANGGGGGENHLKAPRIGKSLTPTTIEKNVASNVKMKTTRRKSTDKEEWSVWNDKTEFLENAQLTKLMSNDDIRALIGKAAQQTENDETSCRDTIDEVDSEMQNMIFSPLLIPVQNNEIQPTQELPKEMVGKKVP